jgi:2'-5' RNA ligase
LNDLATSAGFRFPELVSASRRLRGAVRRPTALIVPVPSVEPILAEWRGDHREETALGPHITILYPFLPPWRITRSVERELGEMTADIAFFDFQFSRIERFPQVHYLAPEPEQPFIRLTEQIVSRWPGQLPYGGAFNRVVPHLTVATDASEASLSSLARRLPLRAQATVLQLVQQNSRGWIARGTWPLAGHRG